MMNLKNTCMFIGRFTKDPELKTKGSGKNQTKYTMFTLGVPRQLTKEQREAKKNGEDVIDSDFPQFTAFGETAQMICDWFGKGKPIIIHAEFQSYKKDDGNGNVEYKSNFVVRDVTFTENDNSKNGGGNGGNSNGNNSGSSSKPNNNANKGNKKNNNIEDDITEIPDDDVPF